VVKSVVRSTLKSSVVIIIGAGLCYRPDEMTVMSSIQQQSSSE